MDSIYIETSVVSHATARPSSDPNLALLQQQAREWWNTERPKSRVVTSQLVLDEAALGDATAAAERLKLLSGLDLIPADPRIEAIADGLLDRHAIGARGASMTLNLTPSEVQVRRIDNLLYQSIS